MQILVLAYVGILVAALALPAISNAKKKAQALQQNQSSQYTQPVEPPASFSPHTFTPPSVPENTIPPKETAPSAPVTPAAAPKEEPMEEVKPVETPVN